MFGQAMVDVSDTREANRSLILRTLVLAGAMPRAQLAAQAGLSKATVSRVVEDLVGLGVAREGQPVASVRRGPNPAVVEFRGADRIICGVDVGASNTRIIVSDLGGRLLKADQLRTAADLDSAGLARWLSDQIAPAPTAGGRGIEATVVGVPGVVHPGTGAIRHADNLPAIDGGQSFRDDLRSLLPGGLTLGNDANLALIGERAFGAARGCSSAVMFTIGTGIGTGVLVNDRAFVGRSGLVGEFAYLRIPQRDGAVVALEEIVGGPALLRRAAELGHPVATPGEIFGALGQPGLKGLRQEALDALHALFTVVTLAYEPEVIVVGGGVAPALRRWLPDLQASLTEAVPEAPRLVLSQLGDFAGALGALARAWQEALVMLGLSRPGLESASAAQLGPIPGLLRSQGQQGSG